MGKRKNSQPKRKRNKSSPGQKPLLKRNKLEFSCDVSDSEGEGTDYFDAVESDSSDHTPPPIMQFTHEDLVSLSSKLAPLLIKDLKQALKEECLAELKHDIKDIVQTETKSLRDEVTGLQTEVARLSMELKQAKLDHDELAQYGRRMCLDISNLPGDTGNYDEPVESKILEFAKKSKIALKSSDIDKCHRKGKPKMNENRKVIIKFTNSKARDNLYKSRKGLTDGLFVQENLTPHREYLGYEARQLKRENLIDKTWIAGCRVLVQLSGESAGRVVKSMDVISAIREGKPLPTDSA